MRPLKLLRPASFAVLAALALPALAAGWSSFENTFPALPCQDGWAGCVVDGVVSGPGALKDAAGRPLPADARFGWFDLRPTQNVSPFTTLSAYSGPMGGVAVAEAAVAEPVAQAPDEAPPVAEAPSAPSDSTGGAGSSGSGSTASASSGAGSSGGATVAPTAMASNTTTSAPAPVAASGGGMRPGSPSATTTTASAPTPAATPTATTSSMRPGSPSATATAPTTTTAASATPAAKPAPAAVTPVAATPPTTSKPAPTPVAAAVAPVASAPQDDSCGDLVKLEPAAMMGQLRPGQNKCLEARIGSESQQTTKDKVSRLMITNAEAKGDKADWERLMKRHLEDIDRSDPDLCFKYALHLSRGGVGRTQGVIRWADYSLENKSKWSGQTYKTRVFSLYKLRAEAANKLWQEAEKEFAEGERTDEKEAKAAKYRGQAKDYAREWLDYAKASAQDTKTAMALCVSSSGNRAFCEGG